MWIQNTRDATLYQCDRHHLLKMPYATTDCSLWSIHTRSISVLTTPPSVQAPKRCFSLFVGAPLSLLELSWIQGAFKRSADFSQIARCQCAQRSSRGGSQIDRYCCHKVALFHYQMVISALYKPFTDKHVNDRIWHKQRRMKPTSTVEDR